MPGMKVLSSSPPAHRDFRFLLRSLGPELDPFPAEEEPREDGGAEESKEDIGGAEKDPWSGK